MLMIRLQRVGRTNDPSFRVVVVDSHEGPKTGRVVEVVGNYDARSTKGVGRPALPVRGRPVQLKAERIKHWLAVGAQTSSTVHNLLVDKKIISAKKISPLPQTRQTKAASAEPAPPSTPPEATEVAPT